MDRRHQVGLAVVLLVVPALGGCIVSPFGGNRFTETTRSVAAIEGLDALVVRNVNGGVTVTGEDRSNVSVVADKFASTEAGLRNVVVSMAVADGVLTVRVATSGGFLTVGGATLDIRVPQDLPVRSVSSQNGAVTVTGVAGDVEASTANGRVTVEDVQGTVTALSSNGAVLVRNTTGLAEARSSNGRVDAEVRSVAGDVTVRSLNGDVAVRVAPGLHANVEVSTSNGNAAVSGLTLSDLSTSRTRVTGLLNGGGPRLLVSTSNGNALLQPLG